MCSVWISGFISAFSNTTVQTTSATLSVPTAASAFTTPTAAPAFSLPTTASAYPIPTSASSDHPSYTSSNTQSQKHSSPPVAAATDIKSYTRKHPTKPGEVINVTPHQRPRSAKRSRNSSPVSDHSSDTSPSSDTSDRDSPRMREPDSPRPQGRYIPRSESNDTQASEKRTLKSRMMPDYIPGVDDEEIFYSSETEIKEEIERQVRMRNLEFSIRSQSRQLRMLQYNSFLYQRRIAAKAMRLLSNPGFSASSNTYDEDRANFAAFALAFPGGDMSSQQQQQ